MKGSPEMTWLVVAALNSLYDRAGKLDIGWATSEEDANLLFKVSSLLSHLT